MLVDKIKTLCDKRGETLASLERKMDFGNGTIRRWDKTTPSGDKLVRVADFFHVSVDYLLDRGQKEKPAQDVQAESQGLDPAFFRVMKSAQEKGYSAHDIELAMDFIKRARERDKQ